MRALKAVGHTALLGVRVALALYSGCLLGFWILVIAGVTGAPLIIRLSPEYNKTGLIVGILAGSLVGALSASLYRTVGPYPALTALSMTITLAGLFSWIERRNLPSLLQPMPTLGLLLMLGITCGPAIVALVRPTRRPTSLDR